MHKQWIPGHSFSWGGGGGGGDLGMRLLSAYVLQLGCVTQLDSHEALCHVCTSKLELCST